MVRADKFFKKFPEGKARKLTANFTDLVTQTSQKSEKHGLFSLYASYLGAALKL